jgi:hypothetical protein
VSTTKERPILFSGPMVRAILDGRKRQTRRVVKSQPPEWAICAEEHMDGWFFHDKHGDTEDLWFYPDYESAGLQCPQGKPGDRLWVRETFRAWREIGERGGEWDLCEGPLVPEFPGDAFDYAADHVGSRFPWRPSVHMPRWASRITLEITGMRVERLHELSEADALAEGCEARRSNDGYDIDPFHDMSASDSFAELWESINGPCSWAANPWVWVIEFKRLEVN